jgi:hypothetical protein
MGVDDDVWDDSLFGEGHIGLRPEDGEHALLPVAGGELIADDGVPGDPKLEVELFVPCDGDGIDSCWF